MVLLTRWCLVVCEDGKKFYVPGNVLSVCEDSICSTYLVMSCRMRRRRYGSTYHVCDVSHEGFYSPGGVPSGHQVRPLSSPLRTNNSRWNTNWVCWERVSQDTCQNITLSSNHQPCKEATVVAITLTYKQNINKIINKNSSSSGALFSDKCSDHCMMYL